LSNLSFGKKREMNTDGKEQGYAFSRLWLNDFLKKQSQWNTEKYNERFEIIFERFLQIWQFPNVEIPTVELDAEMSIYDAEPPTHKKLEYFIFEDSRIEESAIAQMYFYVLKALYEKNPELLLESTQVIKITVNPGDFRAPQEFINGYYIEANIESNIKFSNLKKLLSIFELEDELIIKYSSEQSAGVDRFTRRRKFWEELLPLLNHHVLYTKVNPTKDFWLSAGAGISGLSYNLIITKSYAAIELTLNSASKEENKRLFNTIEKHREVIEKNFGKPILWERMLESKMSRIKHQLDHVNFYVDSDLETMKTFFVQNLSSFYDAFNPVINGLKKR